MRSAKRTAPVLAAVALSLLVFGSCDLIQNCIECAVCHGSLAEGDTQITGNAKVDAFFAASIDLLTASERVDAKVKDALGGLAETLGLARTATAAEVSTAMCAAFSSASVTFDVQYEEPKCTADVDIAAKAAAECDVNVDPGTVDVRCEGHCEGTCSAHCQGECRMPSVNAYCEGTCYGKCVVDVEAACYGTCHGTCDGTCSVTEGGKCAGSCSGTCRGKCEADVSAQCTGECRGECKLEVNPPKCEGKCEGTCEGHCEGKCEGTVEPPTADVECQAQVEARIEANVECEPPSLDFGVDTSAIDNIARINSQLGVVLAASAEAQRLDGAVDVFVGTLQTAADAVFSGELTAEQLICAARELDTAVTALQTAAGNLNGIISIDNELMTCP